MLIILRQLEDQYYNFLFFILISLPHYFWPKVLFLISIINTKAIESKNKQKITCDDGKIISLLIEGLITNKSDY